MQPMPKTETCMRVLMMACLTVPLAACTMPARDSTVPSQRIHAIEVPVVDRNQETAAWWFRAGAATAAGNGARAGRAKNVIVFLGDGMSLTTVAAARILDGQRKGGRGEENRLAWERFPNTALSKT